MVEHAIAIVTLYANRTELQDGELCLYQAAMSLLEIHFRTVSFFYEKDMQDKGYDRDEYRGYTPA